MVTPFFDLNYYLRFFTTFAKPSMKSLTYIFLFLFTISGFIPTAIFTYSQKMKMPELLKLLETSQSDCEDSLPMDCSSEENSESKDTHENSESSDHLKDFFANSHLFQLHLSLDLSLFIFVRNSLLSFYSEVVIPPPEFLFL